MYIITMSPQSHMLLGSIMKMSQRRREDSANTVRVTAFVSLGGRSKLLSVNNYVTSLTMAAVFIIVCAHVLKKVRIKQCINLSIVDNLCFIFLMNRSLKGFQ